MDDDFSFCHLGFHFDLRNQKFDPRYNWILSKLDDVNQLAIASYVQLIADSNPLGLPYSFANYGGNFDPLTGVYLSDEDGEGLTCATFVTAVMLKLGWNLVNFESWEARDDDVPVQQQIVQWLIDAGATDEHINTQKEGIGAPRLRAEEAAYAAGQDEDEWPMHYNHCCAGGAKLLEDIKRS